VRDTSAQVAVDSSVLDVVVIRDAAQITVMPKQQFITVNSPLN